MVGPPAAISRAGISLNGTPLALSSKMYGLNLLSRSRVMVTVRLKVNKIDLCCVEDKVYLPDCRRMHS